MFLLIIKKVNSKEQFDEITWKIISKRYMDFDQNQNFNNSNNEYFFGKKYITPSSIYNTFIIIEL
jgi:hypothetical protein